MFGSCQRIPLLTKLAGYDQTQVRSTRIRVASSVNSSNSKYLAIIVFLGNELPPRPDS